MAKNRKKNRQLKTRANAPQVAESAANIKPSVDAHELYLQRGGNIIDLAMESIVMLIQLAKADMQRIAEDSEFKPTVSPSVLVRAIAELRKTRKEREALMDECVQQTQPAETRTEACREATAPNAQANHSPMFDTESEVTAKPEVTSPIPALTG